MGYPPPLILQGGKQPGSRLSGRLQGSMTFRGEPQPGAWETWVLVPFEFLCDHGLVTNPLCALLPHLYVDECDLESFKGLSTRLSEWSLSP